MDRRPAPTSPGLAIPSWPKHYSMKKMSSSSQNWSKIIDDACMMNGRGVRSPVPPLHHILQLASRGRAVNSLKTMLRTAKRTWPVGKIDRCARESRGTHQWWWGASGAKGRRDKPGHPIRAPFCSQKKIILVSPNCPSYRRIRGVALPIEAKARYQDLANEAIYVFHTREGLKSTRSCPHYISAILAGILVT